MRMVVQNGMEFCEVTQDENWLMKGDKTLAEGQMTFFLDISAACERISRKYEKRCERRRNVAALKAVQQAKTVPQEQPLNLFTYIKELFLMPERLVKDNLLLVKGIIKSIRYPSYVSYEDLESEGNLALVVAAKTFDSGRGVKFSSYAYACIRNALIKKVSKECEYSNRKSGDVRLNDDDLLSIEEQLPDNAVPIADCVALSVDMQEALRYIRMQYKKRPSILRGLEAIVLNVYGYKFCDIAKMWEMGENHLTAIFSRTRSVLKQDDELLKLLQFS